MSKDATLRKLQQINQELEALFQRWGAFSDQQLNQQPADGGWSPVQVMHHLILAEGGSLKYVKKKLSFNPELKKAGLSAAFRYWMIKLYFALPLKFKAPAVVGDDALPENASLEATRQAWTAVRQELGAYLRELPEEHFEQVIYKHPFAGRMTLQGMLGFFDAHLRRHSKQIERALQEAS